MNKNSQNLSIKKIYVQRILSIKNIALILIFSILSGIGRIAALQISSFNDAIVASTEGNVFGALFPGDYFYFATNFIIPLFLICSFYQQCKDDSNAAVIVRFKYFNRYERMIDVSIYLFVIVYLFITFVSTILTSYLFTDKFAIDEYYYNLTQAHLSDITASNFFILFSFTNALELIFMYYLIKVIYLITHNTVFGFTITLLLAILNTFDFSATKYNPIYASCLGRYIGLNGLYDPLSTTNSNEYSYIFSVALLLIWNIVIYILYLLLSKKYHK